MENKMHRDTPFITILMCMLFWLSMYFTQSTADNMTELAGKHYDLAWKVSGIEIKWDDTDKQQKDIIRDIYRSEILEAINIAHQSWFNHTQFVYVTWYQDIDTVRLKSTDWSEIEVNIQTKVITTYSPN